MTQHNYIIRRSQDDVAFKEYDHNSCRDGDFFGRASRPAVPRGFWGRQRRAVEIELFIVIKITTINIKSRHLVLRSLGTYWSARVLSKGTCCARGRRITPSAPYLR